MGNIASSDNINNYGPSFQGVWGVSSTAQAASTGLPDSQQGYLHVTPYGYFGCTQRFTTRLGYEYVRQLTAAWNGTNGPWDVWRAVGYQTAAGYFSGDLNALVYPGKLSVTTSALNLPANIVGNVTVELRSSGEVLQTYRSVSVSAGNADREWKRTGNGAGTAWTAWTETATVELVKGWGLGVSSTTAPNYIFNPAQSGNTTPTQFVNAKTSDDQSVAHNPVSGEEFAGVNIQRDLRPIQVGVSGRGPAASLWFRGYSTAGSLLSDWKQVITTADAASVAAKGVVKLSNATNSTSQELAATPKAISDAIELIKALMGTAAGKNIGVAAGQIPDMSFFEALLTNQSGYQKLPGGLILQWGTATGTGSLLRATYGVAFPNIVFQVLFTMADKTAGTLSGLTPFSNASYLTNLAQATCNLAGTDAQGNASCRYFAVGM
ncbi:tail fiber protein [Pantoea sp. NPDC088449]|uniref:tail fiber protein n=1 Tax=Pantoea sp. NPDC088449 TaxID=3364392 RepID=UPI00381B1675